MVKYTCPKCNKEFNKKSNYIEHINRKFSCIQTQFILIEPQQILKKTEENTQKIENVNIINNNNENNTNLCCPFCKSSFNRKDNLKRHINNFCKEKKLQDQEKENIFKLLLEKEEQMKKIEEENKKREEENKKHVRNLEDYIKQITDINLDLNNKVNNLLEKMSVSNINNGVINNTNNIIITSDKLANFGEEDIKEIDCKAFNKIFGKTGKYIFMESAQNIWNDKPKNKTIYISDLSREKAMTHKNGTFELTPMNKALITVNQQLYKYFKHNLEHIEKTGNTKLKKKFEDEISKYYKMLFRAYDENDRYQPDDNRLEEFERVVNGGLSEFFYNIKDDVKDNYKKIVDDIKNDNILKKINYEPPKKPRGRPKKLCINTLIKQANQANQANQTNQQNQANPEPVIKKPRKTKELKIEGYTPEQLDEVQQKFWKKQLRKKYPKSCVVKLED